MAVCQPGPAVLAATSLMAADGDRATPASMILMGSPIDARQSPTLPNRFETRGAVNLASFRERGPEPEDAALGEERKGLGCCPGTVEGIVRVVRDPNGTTVQPGEILVAEHTDPGWVILFPLAAGLLVERGSLLSHSAIVARELGLPTVVAVRGLTKWLRNGDRVRFDGSTGVIRRLDSARRREAA